jgi:hypothetical protein
VTARRIGGSVEAECVREERDCAPSHDRDRLGTNERSGLVVSRFLLHEGNVSWMCSGPCEIALFSKVGLLYRKFALESEKGGSVRIHEETTTINAEGWRGSRAAKVYYVKRTARTRMTGCQIGFPGTLVIARCSFGCWSRRIKSYRCDQNQSTAYDEPDLEA